MTRPRHDQRGAALVEFAILLPLVLVLLFGVIDFGRLLYTRINLHEAVQEGSIYASTSPDDPAGVQTRVVESVDNPALATSDVTVQCPGETVKVLVAHDMDLITPLFAPRTITVTAEVVTDRFTTTACVPSP